MPDDPITRLNAALEGRYRIERQLGEGGMATVYLADDLRHERKVALKVLKPELAAVVGAERFLTEIKTTANLQHPHILPLFDSGEADSFLFYVMPYVEGESLRERLDREHQLPVAEAMKIATAVANGLDYAHRHGVIHRDIKPANILLHDGEPVVSDFGIALALGAAGAGRLTETGLSLGTPHYMSPEQATGDLSIGATTDVYALGCVLYEMLVGEPPYTGSTPQAVLGKIVTGDAEPVTKHRRSVPPNVEAAIRKAIEKVPADRFGRAAEFASALDDTGFRHGGSAPMQTVADVRTWKLIAAGTSVVAITLLAAGLWTGGVGGPSGSPLSTRPITLTLTPPAGVQIDANWGLGITPDESTVVFFDTQSRQLFRRDLGDPSSVPITGTESSWKPFFSPDGGWLGFFDDTENTLKRIRLDGSGAQTLGSVPPTGRSGAWTEDGMIVFNSNGLGGLSTISEAGGEIRPVARDAGSIAWLQLLPGGRAVLGGKEIDGVRHVVAVDLETDELHVLFPGFTPRYVEPGQLVYGLAGALWTVPFDLENLEALGPPTQIVQGVAGGADRAWFEVTEHVLVYQPGGAASGNSVLRQPVWVDRQGNRERLNVPPGEYLWPRISPDGRKVALVLNDQGNEDIIIVDLESGTPRRLTFGPASDWGPIWTPDGRRVVFSSDRDGSMNLYWRNADGSDEAQRITNAPADQIAYGWTPNGAILFAQDGDVWSVLPEPGAEPQPILDQPYAEGFPTLSPGGRFIAFQSEELGYPEIFVQGFPDLRGKWMVSTLDIAPFSGLPNADLRDGRSPLWSPTGDALYYLSGYALVRVPVSTEGAFSPGVPEVAFDGAPPAPTRGPHFDVSRDGQRILMIENVAGVRNELTVMVNWQSSLPDAVVN